MANNEKKNVEPYYEQYGIPKMSLGDALWQIEVSIKTGQRRGVWCLIADAGVGKSQGVHALAKKHGMRVVDVRTSQFSLISAGVPQKADDDGYFKIAVPDDFPKPGEKTLLLFDEINQGMPHAMAMFFKLLEDRALFNYQLPDECLVVALMNPATAGYSVTRLENNAAFNRRLQKAWVVPSYSEWRNYAETEAFHASDGLKKACHSAVTGLLANEPSQFYVDAYRDSGKQYPCPATWQTVSLSLYNLEASGEDLTSERTYARIAASVGTKPASLLQRYLRDRFVKVRPGDVLREYSVDPQLRENVKKLMDNYPGDFANLVNNVVVMLNKERPALADVAKNFGDFWADLPDEQYAMVTAAMAKFLQDTTEADIKAVTEYMNNVANAVQQDNKFATRYHAFQTQMAAVKDALED